VDSFQLSYATKLTHFLVDLNVLVMLIFTTYEDLFCETCSPQHCLCHVMTERRTCDYLRGMRARGHDFKLPDLI